MRLYSFTIEGRDTIGIEAKSQLIDLPVSYGALITSKGRVPGLPEGLPTDMISFLRLGEPALDAARATAQFISRRPALPVGLQAVYALEQVELLAPVPRPGKILCSGINYGSHAQENPAAKMPTEPFFFSKLPTAVIASGKPIVLPKRSQQVDYEVEFAVVIGKRMRNTPEPAVLESIAGYTILHDVSARDVQFKDNQITLGKNFDTFCPLGPCIVTRDELPAPDNTGIRSFLNGRLMQDGTTADWVFPLPTLLSFLSQVMTLEPGDVVSTGTPAGVGVFRNPPVFLKPGDVVRLEADGIGTLENPVVSEN
jgi:2-keto-4-pentenoate hydratase/2-oxohepta-3-ene-1,7-dioic acid hydratase in catechol pathway